MASERFVKISDDFVQQFTEQNENENTKKKTQYDLGIFTQFLESEEERREIETIPPSEMQDYCINYIKYIN